MRFWFFFNLGVLFVVFVCFFYFVRAPEDTKIYISKNKSDQLPGYELGSHLFKGAELYFFQIKSSATVVKVSIYLHCVNPNNVPRMELNSGSAIQQ